MFLSVHFIIGSEQIELVLQIILSLNNVQRVHCHLVLLAVSVSVFVLLSDVSGCVISLCHLCERFLPRFSESVVLLVLELMAVIGGVS